MIALKTPKPDADLFEWMVALRREFHQYPELAYRELQTTRALRDLLDRMGIENYGFDNLTGVKAVIRGAQPGETIGLRADIDALPIQEENDLSFKSKVPGIMHACGHDAHTAILLGVAGKVLRESLAQRMKGDLVLIFQPAEEGHKGAATMIHQGVLEKPHVDRVFAAHVAPSLPSGQFGYHPGQNHASTDNFVLTLSGPGGHGAHPHSTPDPVVAGAHFVTALQTIVARNINPLASAVITVGKFMAGTVANVIPTQAQITATLRALDPQVREQLKVRVAEMVEGLSTQFGVETALEFIEGHPPCINDPEQAAFMAQVAEDLLGSENVKQPPPSMGGEDFAYFTMARPGALFLLGCRPPGDQRVALHSPHFILDENVLQVGADIFYEAVRRALAGS